jgi:hypothetical protein
MDKEEETEETEIMANCRYNFPHSVNSVISCSNLCLNREVILHPILSAACRWLASANEANTFQLFKQSSVRSTDWVSSFPKYFPNSCRPTQKFPPAFSRRLQWIYGRHKPPRSLSLRYQASSLKPLGRLASANAGLTQVGPASDLLFSRAKTREARA